MLNNMSNLAEHNEIKNIYLSLTEMEKIELKINELSTKISELYQLISKLVDINELLVNKLAKK